MTDLLRRAWDTLDTFKQAYPENWHDEDEQVLQDLMRADMKMSGVKSKWTGLTDKEVEELAVYPMNPTADLVRAIEKLLKEKNYV